MSDRPIPVPPTPNRISIDPSLASSSVESSSFWDRVTTWAAEHKAVVYTLAGVTIVATGAGIYYYSSAPRPAGSSPSKKKAKKDKRKAKKEADAAEKAAETGRDILIIGETCLGYLTDLKQSREKLR